MANDSSWLVMLRDVSKTIRVQGETHLTVCMILELQSGDMLAVQMGRSEDEAISTALGGAAQDPAGPRRHGLPRRILFDAAIASRVRSHLADLGPALGLDRAELRETPVIPDAEDVFDSFIGHMSGRKQPNEFASPHEWRMLFELARGFHDAKPWDRWADNVDLLLELTIGRVRATYSAVVIGQEGIQRGLVLYPGPEPPRGLRDWKPGKKVPLPGGTLMFHLDPRGEPPAEFLAKASRYGWPPEAEFVPLFLCMRGDQPADPGRLEVLHMALGIAAVAELDDRGPMIAGQSEPVAGWLKLPDLSPAEFRISQRPPEGPEPGTLNLRVHQVGYDLVPKGGPVSMGSMPPEVLGELRRRAKIHRPAPQAAPSSMKAVPLVAIHPRKASGDAIASRIAHDDPFGISLVEAGPDTMAVLACAEAAHGLMEIRTEAEALALYRARMRATGGYHVVLVADEETTRTGGTIYGMFECLSPLGPPTKAARSPRATKPKRRGRQGWWSPP